jgi:chromosome segregation ATPase
MAEVQKEEEEELDSIQKELEILNNTIHEIRADLNKTTEEGKRRDFDNFTDDKKAQLISLRSDLLSVMVQANTIKSKIKKMFKTIKQPLVKAANYAWGTINQIVQRCITLLSQFNNQMNIDSVTVTLGISTSVAVTLK